MMQAIKVHAHVGSDGVLRLVIPIGIYDQDVETVIVVQSTTPESARTDANGYPVGYWNMLDSIEADDLIERPEQDTRNLIG